MVEELLRLYAAAGSLRTCVKDFNVNGTSIRAGDMIMVMPALAGRDPTEYPDPLEVRFDRAPRHVAFGSGPHTCVGMHLARRELRTAIATMLEMLPTFQVAPGAQVLSEMSDMLQPRALPLVWRS